MRTFFDNNETLFSDKREEIEKKINSFPEPKTDYERAKYQYLCTMSRWNLGKRLLISTGSFVVFFPYYLKLRFTKINTEEKKSDAVFLTDSIAVNTIPLSLRKEFPEIVCQSIGKEMALSKEDSRYLWEIVRKNPFCFYFNLMKSFNYIFSSKISSNWKIYVSFIRRFFSNCE